jgi:hypothetical protein
MASREHSSQTMWNIHFGGGLDPQGLRGTGKLLDFWSECEVTAIGSGAFTRPEPRIR